MSRDLVAMTTPWDGALVMMVDDESMMTDVIQTHLEDAGYTRFVACNDPREAVQLIRQHQPDVLLLDLMMPGVSGFDVLQAVRADEALQYTPVIVLTADASATHQSVINVMDAARRAGLSQLTFATQGQMGAAAAQP